MNDKDRFKRGVVQDDLLYIDGEKEPYHRDPERGRRVEFTGLQIISGYQTYGLDGEPPVSIGERVRGAGRMTDGDRLSVAGAGKLEAPLWVSVAPAPEDTYKYDWKASIGMLEADAEFGNGDEFFIEAYVPAEAFARLATAVRTGRVRMVSLRLKTTLWTLTKESFFGHQPAVLTLAATDIGTSLESGQVIEMIWREEY